MQSTQSQPPAEPGVQLPLWVAAELQDSLLVVMRDLGRLEGLLQHAADNLIENFSTAVDLMEEAVDDTSDARLIQVRSALRSAVVELQFQDMASQVLVHTSKILQACAFRLAAETMGEDEGEEVMPVGNLMPERPNPVTQSEMDAGSIELF